MREINRLLCLSLQNPDHLGEKDKGFITFYAFKLGKLSKLLSTKQQKLFEQDLGDLISNELNVTQKFEVAKRMEATFPFLQEA